MSFKFCTSLQATAKAGANASSTALGNATLLDGFSNEAEGTFCMKTRKDWSAAYASTAEHIKGAIADAVSCDIGNKIINNNPSGFLKGEARLIMNVNQNTIDTVISDIREDENQKLNK